MQMTQEKIGNLCVDAYVMESMAFCVAGMLDSAANNKFHGVENDIIVESACVQVGVFMFQVMIQLAYHEIVTFF